MLSIPVENLPTAPESLDDCVTDTNPVRVVDVFVDELDLAKLGFEGVIPANTGRSAYPPEILQKIYIYGYLIVSERVFTHFRPFSAGYGHDACWL